MNAFLIFCKRQRGCVRRKYPSIEKKEVARVLGEWWASLGQIDRSLYSSLANQHKENLLKPHPRPRWFQMPGGKTRKNNDITQPGIVPGKLADESQLGGLSSLLQLNKEPAVETKPPLPKPLKKRYRDEVYMEPVIQTPPVRPPSPPVVPAESKLEEGENSKPVIESSEEEEERLKVWRTHILEDNANVKRTRARACKGQRYREFMWTSYANRRRTNRWELNQDKEEVIPVKKSKTATKTEKSITRSTRTTKTVNGILTPEKSNDLISRKDNSLNDHIEVKSDNALSIQTTEKPSVIIKKRNKKVTKPKTNSNEDSIHMNLAKDKNDNLMATSGEENADFANEIEMKNNYSGFVLLTPNNNTLNSSSDSENKNGSLQEENRKLKCGLVGSKKRKARRQEIRRLAPGSTFKGVDVIAENDVKKDD